MSDTDDEAALAAAEAAIESNREPQALVTNLVVTVAIARRALREKREAEAKLARVLATVRDICVECTHVHPNDGSRCGAEITAWPGGSARFTPFNCLCNGWRLPRRELRAAIADAGKGTP